MIRRFFRGFFTLLGALLGYEFFDLLRYLINNSETYKSLEPLKMSEQMLIASFFVIIFGIIFYKIAPSVSRGSQKMAYNIGSEMQGSSPMEIIGGAIGVVLGLVIAYLLTRLLEDMRIQRTLYLTLSISIYALLTFIGGVVGSRIGPETLNLVLANQKKQKETNEYDYTVKDKKNQRMPKILDTSVIIDGRILEIMKTGFLEGPIVIPEFVLVELRHIADSSDSLKRVRGRRGLDILNKIQTEYEIQIYNTDSEKALKEIPEVDVKLLKLAQIMKGKVVTNDFNLNKVAAIKGVPVLNINELANAVKPMVIPGEKMTVTLIKQGKDREQAVAYLDDGTMIVVEDGRKYLGQTTEINVTSVLQTAAGRMIFGKVKL